MALNREGAQDWIGYGLATHSVWIGYLTPIWSKSNAKPIHNQSCALSVIAGVEITNFFCMSFGQVLNKFTCPKSFQHFLSEKLRFNLLVRKLIFFCISIFQCFNQKTIFHHDQRISILRLYKEMSIHSPDRLTKWKRNSILSSLHWLYSSTEKCSWSRFWLVFCFESAWKYI